MCNNKSLEGLNCKTTKPCHIHLYVPFGTKPLYRGYMVCCARKRKKRKKKREEKRKGKRKIHAIDRSVRSFGIRTKFSTYSNHQFGIYLSFIFSIRKPNSRFDSCFFRLKFEFEFRFVITCLLSLFT